MCTYIFLLSVRKRTYFTLYFFKFQENSQKNNNFPQNFLPRARCCLNILSSVFNMQTRQYVRKINRFAYDCHIWFSIFYCIPKIRTLEVYLLYLLNSDNRSSRSPISEPLQFRKPECNNTDINYTEYSHTESIIS